MIIFNLTQRDNVIMDGVVTVSPSLRDVVLEYLDVSASADYQEFDDRAHDLVHMAAMYDCYHDMYSDEEKRKEGLASGLEYDADHDYEHYPQAVLLDASSPLYEHLKAWCDVLFIKVLTYEP